MTISDILSEIIGKLGQGSSTSPDAPEPDYFCWYNGEDDINISNTGGGKAIFSFTNNRGDELQQQFGAMTVDGVSLNNSAWWTCPDKFEIEFQNTFKYVGTSGSSRAPVGSIFIICYK